MTLKEQRRHADALIEANATELPMRKMEREFWERVFVRMIVKYFAHQAAASADVALKEWNKRFGRESA